MQQGCARCRHTSDDSLYLRFFAMHRRVANDYVGSLVRSPGPTTTPSLRSSVIKSFLPHPFAPIRGDDEAVKAAVRRRRTGE
jgi:hypothetical protein